MEEKPGGFKGCVNSAVDSQKRHTVFFVDDIMFVAPLAISDTEVRNFNLTPQQLCLSLRLHSSITYSYAMNCAVKIPQFHHKWLWKWVEAHSDYAYPMSLDGHIFKTRDVVAPLIKMDYANPNQLEGMWAKHPIQNKFLMGCYQTPRIINIPHNKVNEVCNNRVMGQSAADLNARYLTGMRVNWQSLAGYVGKSVHVDIDLPTIGGGKQEKISIVTGTLNRRSLLPGVIANTVGASDRIELVLVDGGSTDGTQDYIKSLHNERIKLVEIGGRSPYPNYMNEGIRHASADLICIWNDDVLLETGWDNVFKTMTPGTDVYLFAWKSNRVKEWTIYCNPPVEVVMNYGIYRRSVFEKVGMFNNAYSYYRADGDMAFRAWAFGCTVMPCPDIHVRELDVEKRALPCTAADDKAYDDYRAMYRAGVLPEGLERLAPR